MSYIGPSCRWGKSRVEHISSYWDVYIVCLRFDVFTQEKSVSGYTVVFSVLPCSWLPNIYGLLLRLRYIFLLLLWVIFKDIDNIFVQDPTGWITETYPWPPSNHAGPQALLSLRPEDVGYDALAPTVATTTQDKFKTDSQGENDPLVSSWNF